MLQKPCGPRRKHPEEERHGDDNRRQREDRLVQALTDDSTTRSGAAAAIPYVDREGPSEPDHAKRERNVREAKAAASPGRVWGASPGLIETRRVRRQAAPHGHLSDAIGMVGKDHNHSMNPGANSRVRHILEGSGLRAFRACRGTRGAWWPARRYPRARAADSKCVNS